MPFLSFSCVSFLEGASGNELHRGASMVGFARHNFDPNRFVIIHYLVVVVNYYNKYHSSLAILK